MRVVYLDTFIQFKPETPEPNFIFAMVLMDSSRFQVSDDLAHIGALSLPTSG